MESSAFLAVVAAVAVGVNIGFVDILDRAAALRPMRCLVAVLLEAGGSAPAACPAGGKPHAVTGNEGWRIVSCPDSAANPRYPLKAMRKGGVMRVEAEAPASAALAEGRSVAATLLKRTVFDNREGGLHIVFSDRPFSRFVLCPIIILLGLIAPLWAAVRGIAAVRSLSAGGAPENGRGAPGLPFRPWRNLLMALLVAGGIVAVWQAGRRLAHVRETRIPPRGPIVVRDLYFGRSWREPTVIPEALAVYPFDAVGGTHLAVLIHMDGLRPKLRFLYKASDRDAGLVAAVDAALARP